MTRSDSLLPPLLAFVLGSGCALRGARSTDELAGRLDALRATWSVPGMSAAMARDGKVMWERGFGLADVEAGRPASPDTLYHLCSLTKPYAAVLLLQLVQEARLDLGAPAADFGIQLESAGTIRVEHLLSHTSEGEPGTKFRYNGDRFGKLDRVLEKVAGRSFASLLRERILDPLGLADTAPNPAQPASCREAGRDPEAFARRMARGYDSDGETPVEYRKHFVTAAGLVSTAADVARFSLALEDGRLLEAPALERMFSPAVSSLGGAELPYGLAWFIQDVEGRKLAWHYGWWVGASSLVIKDLARRRTFVLLGNSDGLSRKFDLSDGDILRSPFAREILAAWDAMDRP